jgi:hypothetical protein
MSCKQKGYEELKEMLENSIICKIIIIFFSIVTISLFSYHIVYFIKNPDNMALVYIIVEGLGSILCLIVLGFWIYIKCETEVEKTTGTVPNLDSSKVEMIDEEKFEGINPLVLSKEKKEKKSKKLIVNEDNFTEENPIKKHRRKSDSNK